MSPAMFSSCRLSLHFRCISTGTCHQRELEGGGSQCCFISLEFLARVVCDKQIPQRKADIDKILHTGTSRYLHSGGPVGTGTLTSELPKSIKYGENIVQITTEMPYSGQMMQKANDGPSYSLENALHLITRRTNNVIITYGNNPGASVGVVRFQGSLYMLDSHSRDETGCLKPDGKAVLLEIKNTLDLAKVLRKAAASLTSNMEEMLFEITPMILTM